MKIKNNILKFSLFLLLGFIALVFSPESAKADTATLEIPGRGTITYTYSVSKPTYLKGEPVILNGIIETTVCSNVGGYTMGIDAQLNVPWENRDNVTYLDVVPITHLLGTRHGYFYRYSGLLRLDDLVVGDHAFFIRLLYGATGGVIKAAGYRTVSFKVLPSLPVVTTSPVTNITPTSATGGGNVTSGTTITNTKTLTFNNEGITTVVGPSNYKGQYTWRAPVGGSVTVKVNELGVGNLVTSTVAVNPGQTYYIKTVEAGSPSDGTFSWFSSSASGSNTDVYVSALIPPGRSSQVIITYSESQTNAVDVSGLVWSTTENPTVDLPTKTTDGWKIEGPWTSNMTGLTPDTTYHVRAYATNSAGTAYGNDVTFKTIASAPNITPLSTNTTISPKPVQANGVTQYTITVTATDANGGNDIASQYALVNHQGANTGAYRGYIVWSKQNFPWVTLKGSSIQCGDGLAGKVDSSNYFGDAYINLLSCTTSVSGNIRTTTFGVTFDPSFTTPTINNTLSTWVADLSNASDTWRPFDVFILDTTTPPLSSSLPDLIAGPISPAIATTNVSRTYTSTISNIGTASTVNSFSNFFQTATAANGGGTITNFPPASMNALNAGGRATATSPSITFSSTGTFSIRACADKSNPASTGSITELDENNNCSSSWTTVTVTNASVPVNGGWSSWGSCVGGTQSRTCTNPTPANSGTDCSLLDGGNSSQICVGTGTCIDGIKNGDETSADIGGRCGSGIGGSCTAGYTGTPPNCTKKKPIFIED